MKRNISIFSFLLIITLTVFQLESVAQSQRVVLLEQFTSASCDPCAVYNPIIDAFLEDNETQMVGIKYQSNFGYDPMYEDNPTESDARTDFYDISGYPNTVLDGNFYNGFPGGISQELIEERTAVAASINLEGSFQYDELVDGITGAITLDVLENVSSDLVLQTVILEKEIVYDTPPGSNEEDVFYGVMKKMLPNENGIVLGGLNAGDTESYDFSWMFDYVYDPMQIEVVAFVQNTTTKEVLQAIKLQPTPVVMVDMVVLSVANVPEITCDNALNPSVTVANIGAEAITDFDVAYSINGMENVYSWTEGTLEPLQSIVIDLPETNFDLGSSNELTVAITAISEGTDGNISNNSQTLNFTPPPSTQNSVEFTLVTDRYGVETSWEIINADSEVVYSGEGYPNLSSNGTMLSESTTFEFEEAGCYTFTIYDQAGDGICCNFGDGTFSLVTPNGTALVEGGEFGSSFSALFYVEEAVGIAEKEALTVLPALQIVPNPATNQIKIGDFNWSNICNSKQMERVNCQTARVNLQIVSPNGQQVYTQNLRQEQIENISSHLTIPITDWQTGLYFYYLEVNGQVVSEMGKLVVIGA
ncbi:MAG: T9SS type A sorting domain-containing protein [Chitinophagales bacterium]